jgi:glutathione peroxidase-family protein
MGNKASGMVFPAGTTFHSLEAANIGGTTVKMSDYAGSVCLVVNVASK